MALDCGAATQPWGPQRGEAGRGSSFYCFVLMHSLVYPARIRNVTQSYYYCAANHVDCARVCLCQLFVSFFFLFFSSFPHVVPSHRLLIFLTVPLLSPMGWRVSQQTIPRNNCSEIFYACVRTNIAIEMMHNTYNCVHIWMGSGLFKYWQDWKPSHNWSRHLVVLLLVFCRQTFVVAS